MSNETYELQGPLLDKWTEKGFVQPTDIQDQVFDMMYQGENVVASAPTGSGKTLAYLLPVLQRLKAEDEQTVGPKMMIIVPSAELASQVGDVVKEWAKSIDYKSMKIIGGANVKRQIEKLKKHPEVVVGTTGRMLELIGKKKLKVHQLETLIIDEADALLDDEHAKYTSEMIKRIPRDAQIALFSATMPEKITDFTKSFIPEPVTTVTSDKISSSHDEQRIDGYLKTPVRKRDEALRRLAQVDGMQALVFVRTVAEIELLQSKLKFNHVETAYLHSKMSNQNRQQAISKFKKGEYTYLFTTDVTARGIDIEDLPAVIQYDLPSEQDQYVHRAGRTGRMGKEGIVITFVNDRSLQNLKRIVPDNVELVEMSTYKGQLVIN